MKKSHLLGAVLLIVCSTTRLMAAQVVSLGTISSDTQYFMDMSSDGQTLVAGRFASSSYWTSSQGWMDVNGSSFLAVSGDGLTLAGRDSSDTAIRYSIATSTTEVLTTIHGVNSQGLNPSSLSYDGAVMGGTELRTFTSAGVWDSGGSPTILYTASTSNVKVSGDGLVVAGMQYGDSQLQRSVYDESTSTWQTTPSLGYSHNPYDISYDGSVIVGTATNTAFRWIDGVGVEYIPLGSFSDSAAYEVTADGSIIGGAVTDAQNKRHAALWDETNGWRTVEDLLAAQGVDTTGLSLQNVFAMSDDGNYLGVTGLVSEGYWVDLSATAVPIPATVWLFGSGVLGLVGMARRKKA